MPLGSTQNPARGTQVWMKRRLIPGQKELRKNIEVLSHGAFMDVYVLMLAHIRQQRPIGHRGSRITS